MPIERDSNEWQDGELYDPPGVYLSEMLSENDREAYHVEELTEFLLQETPEVIPSLLRQDENKQGAVAFVACVLDRLDRRRFVDCKVIEDSTGTDRLYYATETEEDAHFPLVELEYEIPDRFEELEQEIDGLPDDLSERLNRLEYRIREFER